MMSKVGVLLNDVKDVHLELEVSVNDIHLELEDDDHDVMHAVFSPLSFKVGMKRSEVMC